MWSFKAMLALMVVTGAVGAAGPVVINTWSESFSKATVKAYERLLANASGVWKGGSPVLPFADQ
jgi:hypothetical protein